MTNIWKKSFLLGALALNILGLSTKAHAGERYITPPCPEGAMCIQVVYRYVGTTEKLWGSSMNVNQIRVNNGEDLNTSSYALKVRQGPVKVNSVLVHFTNGSTQEIQINKTLFGSEAAYFQLEQSSYENMTTAPIDYVEVDAQVIKIFPEVTLRGNVELYAL